MIAESSIKRAMAVVLTALFILLISTELTGTCSDFSHRESNSSIDDVFNNR